MTFTQMVFWSFIVAIPVTILIDSVAWMFLKTSLGEHYTEIFTLNQCYNSLPRSVRKIMRGCNFTHSNEPFIPREKAIKQSRVCSGVIVTFEDGKMLLLWNLVRFSLDTFEKNEEKCLIALGYLQQNKHQASIVYFC